MKLIKLFKQSVRRILFNKSRRYKGLYLPLIRSAEGLSDDQEYVNSAVEQIDDLLQYCELTSNTQILDFGCGQGRLANGLLFRVPNIGGYLGIDTDAESIKWCKHWIERHHSKFTFFHLPAQNARYNPSAKSLPTFPTTANSFDVAFLISVFSHMLTDDVKFYLSQLHEALCKGGLIYTTAFIEEGVPNIEENPQNYIGKKTVGALHRVRYEKSFFFGLVEKAGFSIVDFQHQKIDRTQQSVVVLKKIT